MTATNEIPDDTALPALAEIRAAGLARALAGLGVEDCHLELMLRGYSPGSRATIEARTGPRRFAVKAYGEDPSTEAELYEALAAAGCHAAGEARAALWRGPHVASGAQMGGHFERRRSRVGDRRGDAAGNAGGYAAGRAQSAPGAQHLLRAPPSRPRRRP